MIWSENYYLAQDVKLLQKGGCKLQVFKPFKLRFGRLKTAGEDVIK